MPTYAYKAVTRQGEVKTGQITGSAQQDVIAKLQAMDLIPISAEPQGKSKRQIRHGLLQQWRKRIGRTEIAEFTRQLTILLSAGLPLDRALDIMRSVSNNIAMNELISTIQTAVRGGDSLSSALQAHPQHFSSFYINFVKAAEYSGNLAASLEDLSGYLEKSRALKEVLISALIYPAILVGVTLISLLIIIVVVLPEFAQLFEDMDAALPASTALVLGSADFIRQYGVILLALLALGVFLFKRQQQNPQWQYNWDQRKLTLPLMGDLISKVEMARLSRSLGTLLAGGVPLLSALKISHDSLQNRVLSKKLDEVRSDVQQGSSLAAPLLAAEAFPEFALQMIQVGEETGKLDEMLIRVADIYDEEVATATRRMLSLLEPALIIGLGALIGGIIMSILVAILSINELPV